MGIREMTHRIWMVAVVAMVPLPAPAHAADDATCQQYKQLLALTPAQIQKTMGQAAGQDSRGEKYETTIRVNDYATCGVYLVDRGSEKLHSVICDAVFDSNEFALFVVQSAKVCLQDILGKREVAEIFHNERYWATKVGGSYFPGRPKGDFGGDYTSVRIEKLYEHQPDVSLYVYYFHD